MGWWVGCCVAGGCWCVRESVSWKEGRRDCEKVSKGLLLFSPSHAVLYGFEGLLFDLRAGGVCVVLTCCAVLLMGGCYDGKFVICVYEYEGGNERPPHRRGER